MTAFPTQYCSLPFTFCWLAVFAQALRHALRAASELLKDNATSYAAMCEERRGLRQQVRNAIGVEEIQLPRGQCVTRMWHEIASVFVEDVLFFLR